MCMNLLFLKDQTVRDLSCYIYLTLLSLENGSELQNKVNDMKSLISLFVECVPLSESHSSEEIDSAVEVYVESLWTLIPCFQSWDVYLELLCPSDTRSGLTLVDIDAGKFGEPDSLLLRFFLSVARHVSNEYHSSRKASKSKKVCLCFLSAIH